MKTLESYLNLPFTLQIVFDGLRYMVSVNEMEDCSCSASSLDEAVQRISELRKQRIESQLKACNEFLTA